MDNCEIVKLNSINELIIQEFITEIQKTKHKKKKFMEIPCLCNDDPDDGRIDFRLYHFSNTIDLYNHSEKKKDANKLSSSIHTRKCSESKRE